MANRARARELAAEYLAKGEPTGWFEQLYQEAEQGKSTVPWADLQPNPNLLEFWRRHAVSGKTALKIGCGLGDDAEQLSAWGFQTTAFDISPTAIRECGRRFPESDVNYVIADLLDPPPDWTGRFDFVLESYTLQVLPPDLRAQAIQRVACFVRPAGHVLVIARGREQNEPTGEMPWPLTRDELSGFVLHTVSFEDVLDDEDPPVRRFIAFYEK